MKQIYWKTVEEMIGKSDIVLYAIDARFPSQSRNSDVERLIQRKGKQVIYAVTKYDLIGGKKHLLISGVSGNMKEPDIAAMGLMEQLPGVIEGHFEVHIKEDKEVTLAEIALKKTFFRKAESPTSKGLQK